MTGRPNDDDCDVCQRNEREEREALERPVTWPTTPESSGQSGGVR
jgi:hypothetical protein